MKENDMLFAIMVGVIAICSWLYRAWVDAGKEVEEDKKEMEKQRRINIDRILSNPYDEPNNNRNSDKEEKRRQKEQEMKNYHERY